MESTLGMVLIDDSGTPSQVAGSPYLDPTRFTWVAVVANPEQSMEIHEQLPGLMREFRESTGLQELHCADVFSGKGCRDVSFDVRLAVFGALAQIFRQESFRILVQTVDNRTIADLELHGVRFPDEVGPFRMSDRRWLALFFLLVKIKGHLRGAEKEPGFRATFHVDQGLRAPGDVVTTHMLQGVSVDDALHFESSLDFSPLQLADFAAFSFNRMQWALTKPKLSDRDVQLLQLLEPLKDLFVNLKTFEADPMTWSEREYEKWIDQDRIQKGLPPTSEMDL